MTTQTLVCRVLPMKIFNFIYLCCLSSSVSIASESLELMGERLFNDPRFSRAFYNISKGDVNYPYDVKDSKSCASCHLVDQHFESQGMRIYNDFQQRSPIPLREDHKTHALRNSPTLVGIGSKYAQNSFSHFDGEFADHSKTVVANFTGRNMGWLGNEKNMARSNISRVIRQDDGTIGISQDFGGSYQKVFLGIDPSLPNELKLPKEHRLDVFKATDAQIIQKVTFFINEYLKGLDFQKDESGHYSGSVYDMFLEKNNIPKAPKNGQSLLEYSRDLMRAFARLEDPKFVPPIYLETHKRSFEFSKQEWQGLKIFFNLGGLKRMGRGMCFQCHLPPLFTDQKFHNVGVTQIEYDKVHGSGSFNHMDIPKLEERRDTYYLTRPSVKDKEKVDLGLWNFFARKNKKKLTRYIFNELCKNGGLCSKGDILDLTIARFKTPTLRNLNHSAPYFHHGKIKTLSKVIEHYQIVSTLTRQGKLRNAALQLRPIALDETDILDLKAFLDTLNSDYD